MKLSNLDNVTGRYVVATDGPDNRSTFPECWGTTATHDARAVFASDDLATTKAKADSYGAHGASAIIVDRETGRKVGAKRLAVIS